MADHAILYDDDCGFCKRVLRRVLDRDRDGRLHPVAIQSEEGQRLLSEVPPAERLDSWHLVGPSGEVRSAGAAAAPLARLLPRLRWTAPAFERFPGLTDRAYRLVADNRSRLSRLLMLPLLVVALLFGAAGCGADPGAEASVTVYAGAPEGSDRAAEIAAGAELALQQAGGEVDGLEVRFETLEGELTQAGVGASAREATEDSSAVAYIGEALPEATAWSVPITNQAGLLQIAPGDVPEELLRGGGSPPGAPETFQPSGDRTLGALGGLTPQRLESAAAGGFEQELGTGDGEALRGYVAMEAILDSIARAVDPTDRASIVAAYFDAADVDTALGSFTVDSSGRARFADR